MMRVRLKADGRLVEVTSEGQERVLPPPLPERRARTGAAQPGRARPTPPMPGAFARRPG